MDIKKCIENEIGKENIEEFAKWAWGEKFHEMRLDQAHIWWNNLHGDALTLLGSGKVEVDLPKMIQMWKEKA